MWIWLGLAALALIGEVMTGTFYLLLVAVGLAAAGITAWFGLDLQWQLIVCGACLIVGLYLLRKTGILKKREVLASSNADVNMDIGQIVSVAAWSELRTARVRYRGADWQATLADGQAPVPGEYVISEVRGARLVLTAKT